MADYRDLEARGVPEHLWPDDAFQQKYSYEHMMALTARPAVPQTVSPAKAKKGDKVPVRLEFEQRFLLDARRASEIRSELCEPWVIESSPSAPIAEHVNPKPGITVCHIRQFYDDGDRYRHTGEVWGHHCHVETARYVKEKKKSLYLGTSYSANSEEEEPITHELFQSGWTTSARRLQKMRFQVPSEIPSHRTIVDFFYTMRDNKAHIYAVGAEDEALLDNTTFDLYLRFELPIYLRQYLLCMVDSRDPVMKTFRSANMIDTPESIEAFERAISQWYDTV